MTDDASAPTCWLFAPGDSPGKIAKAFGSGADAVILDLEDSVSPERKAEARGQVAEALDRFSGGAVEAWARINPLGSGLAQADLEAVVAHRPAGIVLPKSTSGADVRDLAVRLGTLERQAGLAVGAIRILPLTTETPASLFNLHTYAEAGPRLIGLTWGAEDLSAAIGAATAREADGRYAPLYELARSLCLAGAVAAGVAPIETVYPDFRDLEGLARYAARGRRDGFAGMMAIHPAQVAAIATAFRPSDDELRWAQAVTALFEAHPGAGALSVGGKMVDRPHLVQAQRILARSRT